MSTLEVDLGAVMDAMEKMEPSFRKFLIKDIKERGDGGIFNITLRENVPANGTAAASTILHMILKEEFLTLTRRAFDSDGGHDFRSQSSKARPALK